MITVVGEALVDVVLDPDGSITATSGGAPYNVARICARLGGRVGLIAAVSTDAFGRRLLTDLAAAGVSCDDVQHTDLPTTLALAELDRDGAASYRFYLAGTSATALASVRLPAATTAVVAGGLGLAVEPMAAAVVQLVLSAGDEALVLIDVNCRPDAVADRSRYLARLEPVLARADVVKASVDDLAYLHPADDPVAVAARLVENGPRAVLLTAGAAPTMVMTASDTLVVPVSSGSVVDTIGAGDGFTAGFLTAWTSSRRAGADLTDLALLASAVEAAHDVAGLIVGRRGADPPHRHELPAEWGRIG